MRVVFPLTLVAALAASAGAFAQSAIQPYDLATSPRGYDYSADATRNWYRLEGGRHSTNREENGTSSWEGSGPFGGNPNGN